MTESAFSTATVLSYGLALAGYLAFAIRVAVGSRRSARARLLLIALAVSAIWAALSLAEVFVPSAAAAYSMAEALRYGAWYLFVWHILTQSDTANTGATRTPWMSFGVVAAVLLASVLLSDRTLPGELFGIDDHRAAYILQLTLAVFGLVQIEHVVRRVHPQMRWGIKPLAIALGGIFGLDLYFYADGILFAHLDRDLWVARGLASVIVIPLIAIATARNTGWTVDLHFSRSAVFQSSALLVCGVFLLVVSAGGYLIRYAGGDWGRALQIELLFTAVVLAVLVVSSGRFRSKLKVFVSKHFFSYRYDYREEWLRFTRTLSTDSAAQTLQVRTIVALADLVESPAGLLFLHDESRGYFAAGRWNMPPAEIVERSDGPIANFLGRTGWIISIPEYHSDPDRYEGVELPPWIDELANPWLIVPLITGAQVLGFVVLVEARTAIELDWEVRDLLKTASRQAASYLGQVRATEALVEARKFDAFNRMSAFVVHDLKNLIAQLSLMLKNAQRHRDNPAFQADMLTTVEHVVGRMSGLMLQLRFGAAPVEGPRAVDIAAVVRRVCAAKSVSRDGIDLDLASGVTARGHEDRLEHVIGHLLQNAIDADKSGHPITVRLAREGHQAVLAISDRGVGMTQEFIRERLFKPFETTKPLGMGIGVYESFLYMTELGGAINVESEPGAGTRVTVRLPLAETAAPCPVSGVSEEAA